MATKHLLAQGGGLITVVGQKGLHDGGQQCQNFCRVSPHLFIGVIQLFVDQQGTIAGQCSAAFGIGLGRQQHATDIGMNQDGICGLRRCFDTRQTAHLDAVFGIRQGILIGNLGQTQRLVTYTQTRAVHHHKHGGQTFVGQAHHVAYSAIEHHLASGIAMDAHLVF